MGGVLGVPDVVRQAWNSKEWIAGPALEILNTYGFDVMKTGSHLEFYSSTLNLVTTIDELFAPPRPGLQSQRFGKAPFKCVGVLKDPKVKRVANASVKPDRTNSLQDALPLQ